MARNTGGTFWGELLAVDLYKRNQGRLVRQMTAAALMLLVLFGVWTLSQTLLVDTDNWLRLGLPTLLGILGAWIAYRLVNYPRFADFLIDVEGEMNKVSWASQQELYRATIVVLVTMIFLAAVLFLYDVFWQWLLYQIGVLRY